MVDQAGPSSPAVEAVKNDITKVKRKRDRDGCMNCRRKKRKCIGVKPQCSNCRKTNEHCEWRQPLKFRPENAFTIDEDNSLTDNQTRPDSASGHDTAATAAGTPFIEPAASMSEPSPAKRRRTTFSQGESTSNYNLASFSPGSHGKSAGLDKNSSTASSSGAMRLDGDTALPSTAGGPASRPGSSSRPPIDQMSPTAQFNLSPIQTQTSPSVNSDILKSDGIFLPGSEYQEFHTMLRNGMLNTAYHDPIPAIPTSSGSGVLVDGPTYSDSPQTSYPHIRHIHLTGDDHLTPDLERDLWQNWFNEVSTWIDKFDEHAHFRHTLPIMARKHNHLRFAILALSARQLEMKDRVLPESLSLGLYQEAIHSVLPAMESKDTAVIASCVVLAVLEMLSCSPKGWRRHLDGCTELIRTMDIRGDSGGVEQALFWCIVRMDVCGGLIASASTLIPVDLWTSNSDLDADTAMFHSRVAFEQHANYACYLLGRVLDLFARAGIFTEQARPGFYAHEWVILYDKLSEWFEGRPEEMQPVVTLTTQNGIAPSGPFDTLIFSNGAAISGNQLAHTAMLLLLQKKPKSVVRPARSVLWHARKVCAITTSNSHHGCWTNSIQPLWIAGQLMSSETEHKAIIQMFHRIERETGWGATWRARDLQAVWGDLSG